VSIWARGNKTTVKDYGVTETGNNTPEEFFRYDERNPSFKKNGLSIKFWCEDCSAVSVLKIAQHTGSTYLDLKVIGYRDLNYKGRDSEAKLTLRYVLPSANANIICTDCGSLVKICDVPLNPAINKTDRIHEFSCTKRSCKNYNIAEQLLGFTYAAFLPEWVVVPAVRIASKNKTEEPSTAEEILLTHRCSSSEIKPDLVFLVEDLSACLKRDYVAETARRDFFMQVVTAHYQAPSSVLMEFEGSPSRLNIYLGNIQYNSQWTIVVDGKLYKPYTKMYELLEPLFKTFLSGRQVLDTLPPTESTFDDDDEDDDD
jgi:hypothetical protein